jgi:hypothetical protein
VLAHTSPPYDRLAEFEGDRRLRSSRRSRRAARDVKYHHGARAPTSDAPAQVIVSLAQTRAPEYVDPVSRARARADQPAEGRDAHQTRAACAGLIHGDAAFPARASSRRRSDLQALDGYPRGGTIHLHPEQPARLHHRARATRARRARRRTSPKGFDVPIIHVNADDVRPVIAAFAWRRRSAQTFGRTRYRPDRLPPLRPQRDRRAAYTQPRHVQRHQEPPARAQALTPTSIQGEWRVSKRRPSAWPATPTGESRAAHDELRRRWASTLGIYGRARLDRSASPPTAVARRCAR